MKHPEVLRPANSKRRKGRFSSFASDESKDSPGIREANFPLFGAKTLASYERRFKNRHAGIWDLIHSPDNLEVSIQQMDVVDWRNALQIKRVRHVRYLSFLETEVVEQAA